MTTHTFRRQSAQGDLLIRKIDTLPSGLTPVEPDRGLHVVAHSETGHHHAIEARHGIRLHRSESPLISYLEVYDEACDLVHHRPHDTHGTIRIEPGTYELRRQREYDEIAGWRRVED